MKKLIILRTSIAWPGIRSMAPRIEFYVGYGFDFCCLWFLLGRVTFMKRCCVHVFGQVYLGWMRGGNGCDRCLVSGWTVFVRC